mgnify:CR=1 FL=1
MVGWDYWFSRYEFYLVKNRGHLAVVITWIM